VNCVSLSILCGGRFIAWIICPIRTTLFGAIGLNERTNLLRARSFAPSWLGNESSLNIRNGLILSRTEALSVGLHKATRFSLELNDRKLLPWCAEYFAPQPYIVGRGIVAGKLTEYHKQRMLACLKKRGLA
jgi:hypothetical protein